MSVEESSYIKKKKGTTIISIPYSEGHLIATDLRATNPSTFQVYTCNSKLRGLHDYFTVAGAGYSIGTSVCAIPFLTYVSDLKDKFEFEYDDIKSPSELRSFMSSVGFNFLKQNKDPLFSQILAGSSFLIGFSNSNFSTVWESSLIEDTQNPSNTKTLFPNSVQHQNILAIGSGGRYAKGYLAAKNETKLLKTRDFYEAICVAIKALGVASSFDLASSILEGVSLCKLSPHAHTKYYEWKPTTLDYNLNKIEDIKKYLKEVNPRYL